MLTSTMRATFETTIERRVDRNAINGQPVPLTRVVPLDPVRLVLARVKLTDRQDHVVDGVIVGAVEPRPPALQPRDQALGGGCVTTAALPVHQPP